MADSSTGPDPLEPLASLDPLERLGRLGREAVHTQLRLARRSFGAARAVTQGAAPGRAARGYLEALGRESTRYWRELGTLGLSYAADVLELSARTASRVLDDTTPEPAPGPVPGPAPGSTPDPAPGSTPDPTLDARPDPTLPRAPQPAVAQRRASPGERDPAAAGPARRLPVALRGSAGHSAAGTVTVVNRHTRARRIEVTAGELRTVTGAPAPVTLAVTPARVTLAPKGDHEVTLAVELRAGSVSAGERFTGTVRVSGGDEATVDVTVEVED